MEYNVDFTDTIKNSFLLYAASVAQERAIPDVRDCLKTGLRQGLYAQYTNNLTYKDAFKKALKSVSSATSQSYIHGDVSMYDVFMHAAKPWIYRYPLEAVQGAVGDPCAPDNHSASRYVEMKSAKISDYFFDGLKKDAVDEWYMNYDDTEKIPSVFPSIGYWNICNGCSGIAVAMTTNLPQFNLTEVNNALIKIIKNEKIGFDEIYCAPDFAQGGIIINAEEVKQSLMKGEGNPIRLRAKLKYDEKLNMIRATEMPYGVFTNTVIEQIKKILDTNPNYGIEKVIDHTKDKADIYIYLSKNVSADVIQKKLYEDTALQSTVPINMVMLDKGRFPKVFGWREACDAYITHIRQCRKNEAIFTYNKTNARKNIVDGLILASKNLDQILSIIQSSANEKDAENNLLNAFPFNQEQVKSILNMRLSALTKLDIKHLHDENAELKKIIVFNDSLINDEAVLDEELINRLKEVIKEFGDERRTQIIDINNTTSGIDEKKYIINLYDNNIIKVLENDESCDETNLKQTVVLNESDCLAIFTQKGKYYTLSVKQLKDGQTFDSDIVKIMPMSLIKANKYILVYTQNSLKKIPSTELKNNNKNGQTCIILDKDDYVKNIQTILHDEDYIFILTNLNNYSYYQASSLISKSLNAKAIKAFVTDNTEENIVSCMITEEKKNKITFLEGRQKNEKEITENSRTKKPKNISKKTIKVTTIKFKD